MKKIEKNIENVYCKSTDITFIMEHTYVNNELKKIEVKGFYFGEPNEEDTKEFYNKISAKF